MEIKTADHMTSITLRAVHKEHEGFYAVRLKTWNEVEHSAYIYVKGKSKVQNKWSLHHQLVMNNPCISVLESPK